jgi:hypothetical protein
MGLTPLGTREGTGFRGFVWSIMGLRAADTASASSSTVGSLNGSFFFASS